MIIYKGREISSKYEGDIIEYEKIKYIQDNYYNENKELALSQLQKVLLGGTKINYIYSYYFERLAGNTILYHSKYSINEVLSYPPLIQVFINKTYANSKVFNKDIISNFKTAIRLGGKGICGKPSNFPFKNCKTILEKYKGKLYVDTSCGWGVRMLASACLDINYVGFDINTNLCDKLKELGKDIQKFKPNWKFKILNIGSENYIERLYNKVDIMFTSPPYFNLEDYGNKDKLTHSDYKYWLDYYVTPLLKNSFNYIKNNKYVLINVKNFKNYQLCEDFIEIAIKVGFTYVGYETLNNTFRPKSENRDKINNNEQILVFKKEQYI